MQSLGCALPDRLSHRTTSARSALRAYLFIKPVIAMNSTRFLVLFLIPILIVPFGGPFAPPAVAQEVDSLILKGKRLLQQGYNQSDFDQLHRARALFFRATEGQARTALAHYYVGLARYRAANLVQDDEDQTLRYVNDAINHLQKATELKPDLADARALLSGLYGLKIGLKPFKAMSLGPKSNRAMERAKELAPNNPRVVLIDGTGDYFKPGMFGGDKERALEKFERAAQLAEQEQVDDPLLPSWGHAEACAWIGYAHMEAGRTKEARQAFEHALEINPDYGWVKEVLLPKLAAAE